MSRSARLCVAFVVAIVATGAVPTGVGATGSAVAGSTPSLSLVDQSAWVAPEGSFELTLDITGAPAGAALSVQVHQRVTTRTGFDRTTRGEDLGPTISPSPPTLPLASLPTDDSGHIVVTYPVRTASTPPFGVRLSSAGVYPVTVAVVDRDGQSLNQLVTHLIRLPTDGAAGPQLGVSLIVHLDAGTAFTTDGSAAIDSARLGALRDRVDAISSASIPVTVAAAPETVDALGQLGPDGTALVDALGHGVQSRTLAPAPYAPLDLASWVGTAATDGSATEIVDQQLERGPTTLAAVLQHDPEPDVWIGDGTLDPLALGRLRQAGATKIVVPADRLTPLADAPVTTFLERFSVTDATGNTVEAVQTDPELAGRLTQTADPVLDAHLALADLAVLWFERPADPRGVVLDVPADAPVAKATWDALIAGLTDRSPDSSARSIVSPVGLDTLFDTTAPAEQTVDGTTSELVRTLQPATVAAWPRAFAARAADTQKLVDSYASMLADGPQRADPLRRQILVAAGEGLTDEQRRGYLDDVDAKVRDETARVATPQAQRFTLTARKGEIPLTFENQLPYSVDVELVLDSPKLEFPNGSSIDVTLPAEQATRVEVAVETRASGAFPLDVTMRSPDGGLTLGTNRVNVRSTAVSGIGLVISIAVGIFLLVWWALHFHRVRRSRRLVASAHPSRRTKPGADDLQEPTDEDGSPPIGPVARHPTGRGSSATLTTADGQEPSEGEHVRPHRH